MRFTTYRDREERSVMVPVGTRGKISNTPGGGGVTPDVTPPTLSLPVGTPTGPTTATVGVTTNEANGTLFYVLTTSSTAPTAAQVEAGQNSAGSAAVKSGSQAIGSTGAKTVNLTGLTASTGYYAHHMHRDAAGNRSAVISSAQFTTAAAGDTTAPILSAPVGTQTGSTSATIGATTDEGNGTLYGVVTTSATPPSAAQVEAGQNNGGTAAVYSGSGAVSSPGAKTLSASGLSASTAYYAYLMHKDAAGNRSNVVSSSSFTTAAAVASRDWQFSDLGWQGAMIMTPSSIPGSDGAQITTLTDQGDYHNDGTGVGSQKPKVVGSAINGLKAVRCEYSNLSHFTLPTNMMSGWEDNAVGIALRKQTLHPEIGGDRGGPVLGNFGTSGDALEPNYFDANTPLQSDFGRSAGNQFTVNLAPRTDLASQLTTFHITAYMARYYESGTWFNDERIGVNVYPAAAWGSSPMLGASWANFNGQFAYAIVARMADRELYRKIIARIAHDTARLDLLASDNPWKVNPPKVAASDTIYCYDGGKIGFDSDSNGDASYIQYNHFELSRKWALGLDSVNLAVASAVHGATDGSTPNSGIARIPTMLAADVDAVVLDFGTNDLNTLGATATNTRRRYLADQYLAAGKKVFNLPVKPRGDIGAGWNALRATFNGTMQSDVGTHATGYINPGSSYAYADAAGTDTTMYSGDLLHWNGLGNSTAANDVLYPALRDVQNAIAVRRMSGTAGAQFSRGLRFSQLGSMTIVGGANAALFEVANDPLHAQPYNRIVLRSISTLSAGTYLVTIRFTNEFAGTKDVAFRIVTA